MSEDSEKREGDAFFRGMIVGSTVGIVIWILILLAVLAAFLL